jgi:hypothetical protein
MSVQEEYLYHVLNNLSFQHSQEHSCNRVELESSKLEQNMSEQVAGKQAAGLFCHVF